MSATVCNGSGLRLALLARTVICPTCKRTVRFDRRAMRIKDHPYQSKKVK